MEGDVPKVQVVFQGGGARVAALLAAAHALREAEADGRLVVSRVAGASAGAIAAVLFASDVELAEVRAQLLARGDKGIARMFPRRGRFGHFFRAARGMPLYDVAKLRALLEPFVAPERTLDGLRIPTQVAVTDHSSGLKKILSGETSALTAIVDSSALPFVFRSANMLATNPHLDGGICENLPADDLISKQDQYGPVIGISFPRTTRTVVAGPVQLAARVMELAIDNSVNRAIAHIGEESVCRLDTKLDTFDFARICERGLSDDPYHRIRAQTQEWLDSWIESRTFRRPRVALELSAPEFKARISDIHDALETPTTILRSTMIAVVSADKAKPDEVFNQRKILAHADMRVLRASIGTSAVPADEGEWSIFESAGQEIKGCISVPMADRVVRDTYRTIMLFFPTPLKAGAHYMIRRSSMMYGAFDDLRNGSRDFLSHTHTFQKAPAKESDLVLVVPDRWTVENISFGPDIQGRELTTAELRHDYDGWVSRSGTRAYGWRATDLAPGKRFRVFFERRIERISSNDTRRR
jgi:predicted acylesterase/phospholipase RssA